jgi:hypothetical protein
MELSELARIAVNFYYAHKMWVLIGVGVLVVLTLIKPKPMLKTLGILVGIALAVYIVMLIWDMTFSGVALKEKMIHKSP